MVYNGVMLFQTLVVLISCLFSIYLMLQRNNKYARLTMCLGMLAMIMNSGCFMEISAHSMDGAFVGLKLKYVGGAYITLAFLVFCGKFCKHEIPKKVQCLIALWDSVILFMCWTTESHGLFYTEMHYVTGGEIPHLVREKGIFFYLHLLTNLALITAGFVISLKAILRERKKQRKSNYGGVLICMLFPYGAYFLSALNVLDGFDLLPASLTIGLFLLIYTVSTQKTFYVSDIAHDMLILDMTDPIIILDSDYALVEENFAARKFFTDAVTEGTTESDVRDSIRDKIMRRKKDLQIGESYYEIHTEVVANRAAVLGYCVTIIDLTEQKKQMLHMERLKNEAARANEVKSEFLASMSHEIRTPLNAVLGMTEMIVRNSTEPEIRSYAIDAQNAGSALLSIINDILDISKIESGKMEIVNSEYEIGSLIYDCCAMVSAAAKKKNLELSVDCSGDLPRLLYGDMYHLRQVILNLINNAIKYTEKGSVKLEASGERTESGLMLKISVKDTGIGIKAENIGHLFEKFKRLDQTKNRHIEGTGLGLSISKNLTELMGGEIHVSSEYGTGSEFSITVPQGIRDERKIGDFKAAYFNDKSDEGGYTGIIKAPEARILVVDDVLLNIKVFCKLLEASEVRIDTALSGRECIEKARETRYDMIFLDHMMPEMDGIETLTELEKLPEYAQSKIPVIMLTANALSGAREEYLKHGFTDYLSKPIKGDKLENMLCTYLPKDKVTIIDERQEGDSAAPQTSDDIIAALKSALPEMDIETGLMYCCDDKDFFISIVREYVGGGRLEKLNEAFDSADWETYRITTHSSKSGSRTIGLTELSERFLGLESAAKALDTDYIKANHQAVMTELKRVLEALEIALQPEKLNT